MKFQVEFNDASSLWSQFYTHYGCDASDEITRDTGWINFPCILPTHGSKDHECKGGFNTRSGNYRCWNDTCKDRYNMHFSRNTLTDQREILSPAEFLMITQNIQRDEADRIVESFRLQFQEVMFPEQHHKDTFSTTYAPNAEWYLFVKEAQERLSEELLIVQEYMVARGLRYETIKNAGIGYVPESPTQDECLINPYFINGEIVAIKGRTGDGRKGGVKGSFVTFFQLDAIVDTTSRTVILCEGETDTLVTRQLLNDNGFNNIPVLGIPGSVFRAEWTRHLQKFSRIIMISQSDLASQRLVLSARKSISDGFEVVTLPFPPLSVGKDISDFIRQDPNNGEILITLLGLSQIDVESMPYLLDNDAFNNLARQEPEWIIPGVIERGTKNLIVGNPKTYKTWLALQLIESIIYRSSFLGVSSWTPEFAGTVLLVEEEGSPSRLSQRWQLLTKGLKSEGKMYVIHRQGVRVDDDIALNRLRQEVLKLKPDLIIFDPYASIHAQDENSVQGTMKVMGGLSSLIRSLPTVAILVIHHAAKGAAGPRGSSAIWGAVDTQMVVERLTGVDSQIKIQLLGRDLPEGQQDEMEFTFDPISGRHKLNNPIPPRRTESLCGGAQG